MVTLPSCVSQALLKNIRNAIDSRLLGPHVYGYDNISLLRMLYRLHLQGRKIRERRYSVSPQTLTLVPRSRVFLPWRWRRYVPPKRRFTQDLQGATSQKTALLIVTAVKTSTLTYISLCLHKRKVCFGRWHRNWKDKRERNYMANGKCFITRKTSYRCR
jgi:hypothetical protein